MTEVAASTTVDVKPTVGIGPTTVAGGTVTVAAFAAAIVAFANGATDEATIGPLIAGTIALVTTLFGRYAQAVAAIKATAVASGIPAGTGAGTLDDQITARPLTLGAYESLIRRIASIEAALEEELKRRGVPKMQDSSDGETGEQSYDVAGRIERFLDHDEDEDRDPGPDLDAPTGRETEGELEVDDVEEELVPSFDELGGEVRHVEAHRGLRDPADVPIGSRGGK